MEGMPKVYVFNKGGGLSISGVAGWSTKVWNFGFFLFRSSNYSSSYCANTKPHSTVFRMGYSLLKAIQFQIQPDEIFWSPPKNYILTQFFFKLFLRITEYIGQKDSISFKKCLDILTTTTYILTYICSLEKSNIIHSYIFCVSFKIIIVFYIQ